ncbi:hypothetical protein HUN08_15715 [Gordonia sp. X0973]|uniref:hypothetical protein n=1 Tax=Gordonia sp. X0973 TaxID=2742602 RepID=UPI000F523118|nr:hypothetical protein [Gordonia sp. X0973]QKT08483.1 hypothetical protein HUN08_15715 [Gordonia sp. X0973]
MNPRIKLVPRAVLWAWIAGTAVYTMPGDQTKVYRLFGKAGIPVPNWKFFAPVPATTDLVIVYRDLDADGGGQTPWKTVAMNRARGIGTFWPPPNRDRKAYSDLTQEMRRAYSEHDNDQAVIRALPAYRQLAAYVCGLPRLSETAARREFMVVEAHTSIDSPTIVPLIVSEVFDLPAESPAASLHPHPQITRTEPASR